MGLFKTAIGSYKYPHCTNPGVSIFGVRYYIYIKIKGAAIGMLKNLTGNGAKEVLNCVYGNRAWEDTLT